MIIIINDSEMISKSNREYRLGFGEDPMANFLHFLGYNDVLSSCPPGSLGSPDFLLVLLVLNMGRSISEMAGRSRKLDIPFLHHPHSKWENHLNSPDPQHLFLDRESFLPQCLGHAALRRSSWWRP